MARVLVVQHTGTESLGRWATLLPSLALEPHPIHPYLGHRVPPSVEGDALLVLGGPMSAYADDTSPWLPEVRALLATAVEDGVPTLGICLGAQLLTVALGGEVTVGAPAGPEIGPGVVQVTEFDSLLPRGPLPVVQWHHDAISRLPDGAVHLASSASYPHQAFRMGDVAWGLQFHPETTVEQVAGWAHEETAALTALGRSADSLVVELQAAAEETTAAGDGIAQRFARLVTG
jgi:GMP synthase-like glutamine amidotransferase